MFSSALQHAEGSGTPVHTLTGQGVTQCTPWLGKTLSTVTHLGCAVTIVCLGNRAPIVIAWVSRHAWGQLWVLSAAARLPALHRRVCLLRPRRTSCEGHSAVSKLVCRHLVCEACGDSLAHVQSTACRVDNAVRFHTVMCKRFKQIGSTISCSCTVTGTQAKHIRSFTSSAGH
jgi:hypothetical protein